MSTLTAHPARRRLAAVAGIAATAALLATVSPAAAQARASTRAAGGPPAASGATWGTAIEVPGSATLNTRGNAGVGSVSCASAGNCSAGGAYTDSSGRSQAFVVSQINSTWGTAEEVPGFAALNTAGTIAGIDSMSCAAAGNCSAGGNYTDSAGYQAFVVSQAGGTWGNAEEVPGTAALNTGGFGWTYSVSCAAAGNCSAGGTYALNHNFNLSSAFVVSQVNGTWGQAKQVPGLATLNTSRNADVLSVSCASVGNCSAGGDYFDSSRHVQGFVVSQAGGTWGQAKPVPGLATLNTGGLAHVWSVSCASAGNCSASGYYRDSSGFQAFVVSQVNGRWGAAKEIPGTATLNTGGYAGIPRVSCAAAGNCSAGGSYRDSSGHTQAFVVSQVNGRWGTAKEAPGLATLNTGGNASISSVSCTAAGNCSAGGSYTDSSGHTQAFVISQTGGTWGTAKEVPGTATLNTGGKAAVNSVSCTTAGHCSAGGSYKDSAGHTQAFVVTQT